MRILVTAGPTWVKIDDVRIITNIFTGKTGVFLARKFQRSGHKVTLLVNPSRIDKKPSGMEVVDFFYLEELSASLRELLKKTRYDLIVHTAAVSDYYLKKVYKGKIPSREEKLTLNLLPAPKLISTIRKMAESSFLVQFKLEISRRRLIDKAWESLMTNRADLVVANALCDIRKKYVAFVIDRNKNVHSVDSLDGVAEVILSAALHRR